MKTLLLQKTNYIWKEYCFVTGYKLGVHLFCFTLEVVSSSVMPSLGYRPYIFKNLKVPMKRKMMLPQWIDLAK